MMNHEPFGGAQQLVRNDQRSNRIVAGTSASIANDMRVSLGKAREPGRIQAGVHASENREAACRRQCEIGLVAKLADISAICVEDLLMYRGHAHCSVASTIWWSPTLSTGLIQLPWG